MDSSPAPYALSPAPYALSPVPSPSPYTSSPSVTSMPSPLSYSNSALRSEDYHLLTTSPPPYKARCMGLNTPPYSPGSSSFVATPPRRRVNSLGVSELYIRPNSDSSAPLKGEAPVFESLTNRQVSTLHVHNCRPNSMLDTSTLLDIGAQAWRTNKPGETTVAGGGTVGLGGAIGVGGEVAEDETPALITMSVNSPPGEATPCSEVSCCPRSLYSMLYSMPSSRVRSRTKAAFTPQNSPPPRYRHGFYSLTSTNINIGWLRCERLYRYRACHMRVFAYSLPINSLPDIRYIF